MKKVNVINLKFVKKKEEKKEINEKINLRNTVQKNGIDLHKKMTIIDKKEQEEIDNRKTYSYSNNK